MQMFEKQVAIEKKSSRGLSGSTIKMIAIVAMLIDHIGAFILARYLVAYGTNVFLRGEELYSIYRITRAIGRVAFPIFCFLLVEGFMKTRDVKKYALRLGMFALISEIPFNLALSSKIFYIEYQNVYFTLLLGLLTIALFEWIMKKDWNQFGKVVLLGLVLLSGAGIAELCNTDYGAFGVISILILYLYRNNKLWQIAAGCLMFLWEITAPLAFFPILFYNGKRGWKMKYVFYIFYPAHLLILYLICIALGMEGYPAV